MLRRALPAVVGSTLAVILTLSGASVLNAQINRGVIEEIVSDAQGATMAGVQVDVVSLDNNVTARVTTNDSGLLPCG